ncbi:SRPBCC domain-containing protein [Glutamicibacter endophyticus]|uniref:SRPBCC domain-containing protein n=1 Tax=Glutamicibacter endophyticus TaxID=1522174 RepID=UPI003AF0254B
MSSPTPTGQLLSSDQGFDLRLVRELPVPVERAWEWLTDPELTEHWYGPWSGWAAEGHPIDVTLAFEEGAPTVQMVIRACQEPEHLRLVSEDEYGNWDLELSLRQHEKGSELTFVMHQVDPQGVGEIGPGWEYYLDQLVAAINGDPRPSWEDYFPAQQAYFQDQAPDSAEH